MIEQERKAMEDSLDQKMCGQSKQDRLIDSVNAELCGIAYDMMLTHTISGEWPVTETAAKAKHDQLLAMVEELRGIKGSSEQAAEAPEPIIPNGLYTVDREYLVQLITDRQKRIDALEQQLEATQAPASGEVEPVHQWREIGESDWMDCSEEWKKKCDASPEHDARTLFTHPPAKVPEGYALVPESMCLSYEDIENIAITTGWDEGRDDFGEGVLWVGTLKDDNGNETYGLHISCIEVMEEGGLPVQEFQKPELTTPTPATTPEAGLPWQKLPGDASSHRCLVYTPSNHLEVQYRIAPEGFVKTMTEATHYIPLTPPQEQ